MNMMTAQNLKYKKNTMTYLIKPLSRVLIVAVLLSSQGFSQSYFNALFMNQYASTHSSDMALAGSNTSSYSNPFNTFSNPANQGKLKGVQLSSALNVLSINENRSYPAIDQFGDRVTDNIYVVSRGLQNSFSGGVSWGSGSLGVSAASMPFSTPAFFYKEELRGSLYAPNINRDPLIGYHHIEQSGIIQSSGASAGSSFGSWSVGLALRMLHGIGLENQYGVSVLDSTDVSALASVSTLLKTESWGLENSPLIINFGVIKDFGLHLRVSASFQSGYSLESKKQGALPFFEATEDLPLIQWASDTVGVIIDVPAQMELGLRMKPSNPLPTSIYITLAYQDWTQYGVTYSDSLAGEISAFDFPLQETFTIRGGIEHWVSDNVPFRAGLVWSESPIAGELSQSRFSAGSGWTSGPLQFDVAVQLFSVEYNSIDLFIPIGLTPNATEKIRETQTSYSISVSYSL